MHRQPAWTPGKAISAMGLESFQQTDRDEHAALSRAAQEIDEMFSSNPLDHSALNERLARFARAPAQASPTARLLGHLAGFVLRSPVCISRRRKACARLIQQSSIRRLGAGRPASEILSRRSVALCSWHRRQSCGQRILGQDIHARVESLAQTSARRSGNAPDWVRFREAVRAANGAAPHSYFQWKLAS